MALLTSGQETFALTLASDTGLDRNVIRAWELAEESGGYAQARQAQGNHNWLNIGYYDTGPASWASRMFRDPVQAGHLTAQFLRGQALGASQGIRNILHSVGHSPAVQIAYIAASGWASSGYNHGANLRATYALVTGSPPPAVVAGAGTTVQVTIPTTAGTSAPASPAQDDYSPKVQNTGRLGRQTYSMVGGWAKGVGSLRR